MDNKGVCKYFVCGEGDQFITDFRGIAIKITLLQKIGSLRSLPLWKKIGLNSVLFCHRFDRDWNMVARLIPYKGSKLHSPHLVCIIAWIEVFYNLFPAAWQNGKGEESLHLRHPLPVSSKGWFFFLPEQGWFILHCTQGVPPTERQSIPAKLLKTSWDFQVCLCVRNLTFGPIFSSKNTKYRRIISVSLLHIGVPPCHGDRGPLFSFGLLSTMRITFWDRNKISCPVNLRGVGNDFSITFLLF